MKNELKSRSLIINSKTKNYEIFFSYFYVRFKNTMTVTPNITELFTERMRKFQFLSRHTADFHTLRCESNEQQRTKQKIKKTHRETRIKKKRLRYIRQPTLIYLLLKREWTNKNNLMLMIYFATMLCVLSMKKSKKKKNKNFAPRSFWPNQTTSTFYL